MHAVILVSDKFRLQILFQQQKKTHTLGDSLRRKKAIAYIQKINADSKKDKIVQH